VHQITEDAHGFIWFGSHHGLFRYNTETINKFVHNPQNPHSIPSNFISTITRDSSGTMWFSTDKGICFYNEHKEYFERCSFYNSNKEPLPANILQIVSSDNNTMWAYGDRMLFLANTKTMSYERVIVNPTDNYISFIYVDKNKKLWVRSTTGMVYWADPPYLSFTAFGEVLNQPIHSMLFSNNKLWIGYESYGAHCYDIYGKLIGEYSRNRPEGFDIKSDRVRRIFDDGKGRIWMATYNGISVIENGKITHHTDKNTRGLIHPSVYDIYADSKQGIWVSTWAGTLSYAHPYDNVFEHLKSENGLSNNVVSSIVERNGLVWIGTEGGGLNVYNPASGEISKINLNPDFKDEQNVKTLEFDNNGALWVGTFNDGLWIIKSFDAKGRPLSKSKVLQGNYYHLKKEGPYIWAASYYNGIYQIETATLKSVNYPGNAANPETIHTNHSRSLMIDSKGGLWVGTQSGICYRRKGEKVFERFAHNPNDPSSLNGTQVFTFFEDSNHQIWVGTSSGLNRFNPETKTFSLVTVVPGNEIYGLAEDSKKNLWISSDNGITEYNPLNNRFRNFNMEDGLQSNQFNPGAVFCSPSGKIFFGGPNGLTIFHPDQIKSNPIAPRSVVVGIHINNQLQVPSDSLSVMHESILKANHFKLKHDQNSITFGFVANNFLNPQKNTFRYRLVNYDNQWIEAGTRKTATYTKIPPGQYVFQVIAANNDGYSNDEPTEVHFTIEAPWWKKWYAYTAYMITVLVSIFFIQREILIRHRLRNEILVEKIRSQSEQELNQAKLTFFTNISHEIKTPLSLILSPLDFLLEKRKGDKELTDVLKTIQRNGNRLKYLLHQVIDIRRIDAGKLTFSPGNHNVVSIIKELLSCFTIEASEREIDFRFESEFESLSTQIDPDKFDKILFNLLT
jgi:ligand-binding sensor domain-containing protein